MFDKKEYKELGTFLEPDDPEPFELYNIEGKRKALIICDHASPAIPKKLSDLGIEPQKRYDHIAWDIGAADVTRELAKYLDAKAVLSGFSRLVIDCNREPGSPTSILEVSDGVDVPGNKGISEAQAESRFRHCFLPYHEVVEKSILSFRNQNITPAIISIHSFTPVFDSYSRPWDIGILWDLDDRMARPALQLFEGMEGVKVGDNEPYSGRDESGSCIKVHALSAGLPHILIEVRQDLIDAREKAKIWAKKLGIVLEKILADERLYQVKIFNDE